MLIKKYEYRQNGICRDWNGHICYILEVVCLHTKKNIANVLRKAKIQSGMSLEEFSMEMELAKSTLQSYMKGDDVCNPTVNTLLLIAKKLHTTVTELVSDPALLERIPTKCKECVFFRSITCIPYCRSLSNSKWNCAGYFLSFCMRRKKEGSRLLK